MEVVIPKNPADVGRLATDKVASVVRARPKAVIGLATGSSPAFIYAELARRVRDGEISFAEASGFALDEYVGIPFEHPQSYASVISREVVEPLGFEPARIWIPDGRADDIDKAATEYDEGIAAAGGIDVQILGIGANGHIGFNESTSSFSSRTRVNTLAPRTREDNARFFVDTSQVPIHCIVQGLGTILEARQLVLVAQGSAKAEAIARAVEGPVSSMVPASALQLHPHAIVIVDEAAGSQFLLADYCCTFANKPVR